MSDNTMTVRFPGGEKVAADYSGFEILTDQSPKNGGEGSAPEPFDLFLASLATCAGIYVLRFCTKRDLDTEGLAITQSWRRDEKTRRIEEIALTIQAPAGFPEKYLPALERAAAQCSVKKTLQDPPDFVVTAQAG